MRHDDHADHYLAPHAAVFVSQCQGPSHAEGGHCGRLQEAGCQEPRPEYSLVRTCEALNGRRMQPTHYRVVWFYKGNKPDADNCLARCKAYLDGACKAMGIDDRTLDCAGIDRIHDLGRAGQVEIVFERRDDENA